MDTRGQALVELVASATGVVLALSGASWVLRTEWDRARCAYLVFERAHERLVGLPGGMGKVNVFEDDDAVRGEAKCGSAVERVELRRLESLPKVIP